MNHEENRVGVTLRQKCGMNATCIAYRNSKDVDFEMEDGSVVCHKRWTHFKDGKISPFSRAERIRQGKVQKQEKGRAERLGKTVLLPNGKHATCIEYRNSHDCDFQLDDGSVAKHRQWTSTKRNVGNRITNKEIRDRVGKVKIMKSGEKAKCINWFSADDCLFEMEDGRQLHAAWYLFEQGRIGLSGAKSQHKKESHVGVIRTMNNGVRCKCVSYNNWKNANFEFEDGARVNGIRYTWFNEGVVGHPDFDAGYGGIWHGVKIVGKVFSTDKDVFYRVEKNKDEYEIMSPHMILKKANIELAF